MHEAICIALLSSEIRTLTFAEIARFITKRDLYPNRKGNIPLETQIMLRSTKSRGRYAYLFDQLSNDTIRLRNN